MASLRLTTQAGEVTCPQCRAVLPYEEPRYIPNRHADHMIDCILDRMATGDKKICEQERSEKLQ
jgi:hypothetical protein